MEISEKFINFVGIYRYMARQLTQIADELRLKIRTLASQRDDARRECAVLADKVLSLEKQLQESAAELRKARMEVDFLTIAGRVDSPDNLIAARRRIQRLMARIDRCVALLKEDADIL